MCACLALDDWSGGSALRWKKALREDLDDTSLRKSQPFTAL